jgi:hypothetical protein
MGEEKFFLKRNLDFELDLIPPLPKELGDFD